MSVLKKGDTIAIISCSNGLDINMKNTIDKLVDLLKSKNLNIVVSNALYKNSKGITLDAKLRASELMKLYYNKDVKIIFDLSGGDLCNELLDYLNYDDIIKFNKPFVGYSDLTVILNALYVKTNSINFNYQLRNLIKDNSNLQVEYFMNTFLGEDDVITKINYEFIKGKSMEGVVIGGNIRCFLKLAGTKYIPSFQNKILFLEALSGDINKISTFIAQYKQICDLNKVRGIILGTFTELEKSYSQEEIVNYFLEKFKDYNIPIIKTSDLGHNYNSKAIPIGKHVVFK